jgi:hypothetical protein
MKIWKCWNELIFKEPLQLRYDVRIWSSFRHTQFLFSQIQYWMVQYDMYVYTTLATRESGTVKYTVHSTGNWGKLPERNGRGGYVRTVAYSMSYVYTLQGAKSNGRGAKEKPSRFSNLAWNSNRVTVLVNTSDQTSRTIFETPQRRSGRGFLAVHRSGRGMKSACYCICVNAANAAVHRSSRGISAAVKNKKVVISNAGEWKLKTTRQTFMGIRPVGAPVLRTVYSC